MCWGGRVSKSESSKEFNFTRSDFERVRALIYQRAGISLADSKQEMVYSRIARRLRATGQTAFSDYLNELEAGRLGEEWEAFVNALTTNLTSFFRESHHFPLLAEHLKRLQAPITIWCSASSTGEEPYSIAMTACEAFNTLTPPVQIIATDIDTNVLATGEKGVYGLERLDKMSAERMKRFFLRGKGAQKKPLHALSRHFIQSLEPVHAFFTRREHIRVDIGGDDLHRRRQSVEGFASRHGDGIRFFPRGTGRTPDGDGRLQALQVFRQQGKMVRFAEEGRQVGGEGIDERLPFLAQAPCFQFVEVIREGGLAGGAQAAGDTAVDHFLLAVGQRNAGTLVDQGAHPFKITAGEIEFLA